MIARERQEELFDNILRHKRRLARCYYVKKQKARIKKLGVAADAPPAAAAAASKAAKLRSGPSTKDILSAVMEEYDDTAVRLTPEEKEEIMWVMRHNNSQRFTLRKTHLWRLYHMQAREGAARGRARGREGGHVCVSI